MRIVLRNLCFVLLTLLVVHGLALCQTIDTGAISGSVKDSSGAVISGATVKITNNATKNIERTVTTGNDGNFKVQGVAPGEYRIDISAKGFGTFTATIAVAITETSRINGVLQVGTTATVVEVQAAGSTLVNTESAVTGQAVDARTLASLPLPVPNFLFLLSLSSGTSSELPDVRAANRGIVDINVNGQRTSNNSLSLEGINVNDFNLAHFDTVPLPNTHAIEEFKVATSLYDASSGSKGGGAVGLVFKSGTKDWHGEAYWQHRNDIFNANEWFFNHNGLKRQKFLQNVLGFSASGPVPLAGGFWFVNTQGIRARNAVDPNSSSTTATIPIFATNPDGTTSAALLGGTVDPTALNILNLKSNIFGGTFLIPRPGQTGCKPNAAGTVLNCTFAKVAPIEDTQYSAVYDRPWRNGKDKISGRWFWDNGNVVKPFGTASSLAFPQTAIQNNRFLSISEVHQISDRQLNEFRAGFTRYNSSFIPTDLVTLAQIGATRPNQATVPGIYRVNISGAFSLGTGVNDDRGTIANTFYYGDTWSYSRGQHNMKAGVEFTDYQLNRQNRFAVRGDLAFSSFNSFVAGNINTLQSGVGDPQRYFRDRDYSFFYEDDVKALPRLTVNLGLRWDIFGYAHDKFLRGIIYDPTLLQANPNANPYQFPEHSTLPGLVGTKGIGDCGTRKCREWAALGPRIGMAWDVFGTQKTVVRTGYGMFYQRLSNQNLLQGSLAAPFFVQLNTSSPGTPLSSPISTIFTPNPVAANFIPQASSFAGFIGNPNTTGIPLFLNSSGQACASPFGNGTAVNCSVSLASYSTPLPKPHTPYNQQWNLTVQQELGKGWAVEVGYVGAHYVHGLGIYNPFQAPLASPTNPITVKDINGNLWTITANTLNNEPARNLALGISRRAGARLDGDIGTAIYHSGQLTVSHRFGKGLYFQAGYTYSKEMDNVSGSQSTDELNATRNNQLGANLINNQSNPSLNRTRGDFDRPHRLIVSYAYDLPVPKSGIWGTQAFQGWSISGITTWQNGLPFSVLDNNGNRAFGSATNSSALFTCSSLSQGLGSGSIQSRVDGNYFKRNPDGSLACFSPVGIVPFGFPTTGATAATGFGNMSRNAYRGPTQQNWDFAVAKRFAITERQGLDFRTDFFNIFNHPSFLPPSSVNISAPATFGTINSTAGPARLIQFGLRYSF